MGDLVRESAQAGRLVLWEEVARDGAQANTLLLGPQRVAVARAQAALFGEHGPQHLIFAAGFPAVCSEEREAIREVVDAVDTCQLACHARCRTEDIDLALQVLRGARYGRLTLIVPTSARLAGALLHRSIEDALAQVRSMVRYALDRDDAVAVDLALMDAPHADRHRLAETIAALIEEGIGIAKICDSMGELFPAQIRALIQAVAREVPRRAVLGVHLHNDFGLALANNLEAVQAGIRVVSSAWLGLGERNGLAATEQVLASLAYQPESLTERLPGVQDLWETVPDLRGLPTIARQVSAATGVPLKVTDPIVGTGINVRATGTAFVAPEHFQPFDPALVLGIPPKIRLTQLASHRLVGALAAELGHPLTVEQASTALQWVKSYTYQHGTSVIPREVFTVFLEGLHAQGTTVEQTTGPGAWYGTGQK
jgi:2-isopropylmalate synthase